MLDSSEKQLAVGSWQLAVCITEVSIETNCQLFYCNRLQFGQYGDASKSRARQCASDKLFKRIERYIVNDCRRILLNAKNNVNKI
jgi:hypothetical protein